jgi:hypothetical protein
VPFVVKTVVVQTVTYFVVGSLAFLLLDYHRRYAEPPMNAFLR